MKDLVDLATAPDVLRPVVAAPGREDRVLAAMEILERGSTWRAPGLA